MKRLILLIGLAIGYVLGSKAGREQYRKIKDTASKTWQSPAVRNAAEKVEAFVDEKAPALGGVAHSVLGDRSGGSASSGSASGGSGSSTAGSGGTGATSGASGGASSGPGEFSTDTGFGETGSATGDAATSEPATEINLGDDLKLDTDLGTEGERPA